MFTEELYLISPSSFRVADRVRLAELRTMRVLLPSARHTLRAPCDALFRQAEVTPNIIAEIDSVSMIKAAMLAGIDATIHPRSSWTDELQAGLVRASRVTDFSMHLNFWLSRSAAPSTHAAEAVGTVLEKIVADTAPAILNKV